MDKGECLISDRTGGSRKESLVDPNVEVLEVAPHFGFARAILARIEASAVFFTGIGKSLKGIEDVQRAGSIRHREQLGTDALK